MTKIIYEWNTVLSRYKWSTRERGNIMEIPSENMVVIRWELIKYACLMVCRLLFACHFLHISVYHSHGSDIDYALHGGLEIGEMDGLVQSHLYRPDNLHVGIQRLQQFVAAIGRAHVGENQRVDVASFQFVKRIFVVAQTLV